MASRAAEISLTGRLLPRLDMDRTETLLLAHHDERSAPAHLLFPAQQVGLLLGGRLARQQADGLDEQEARRHPQELSHLLRVGHLARGNLDEVGVRHFRQRDLEDVELLALHQRQEKLQRSFQHLRAYSKARASKMLLHQPYG